MRPALFLFFVPLIAVGQPLMAIVGATDSIPYSIFNATGSTALRMGDVASNKKRAQSFVPASPAVGTIHVNKVTVSIAKVGAPGDNVTAEIWSSTGAPNPSALLYSSTTTIVGSTLTTTMTNTDFLFSTVSLNVGTKYWVVIAPSRGSSVDGTNYYTLASSSANPFAGGGMSAVNVSWTVESGAVDIVFSVVGVTP